MRSITTLDLQYAHRFYGFKGEAQYLHGHTGVLTIEVEDTVEPGVNMVFPCNEIQKTAWSVLKNFDHALILRQDDPLLPAILKVYEEQGIRNGAPRRALAKTGALRQLRPGCFVHWTRRAKAALDPDRVVALGKSLKNTTALAR